jgi:hypothetical protein
MALLTLSERLLRDGHCTGVSFNFHDTRGPYYPHLTDRQTEVSGH